MRITTILITREVNYFCDLTYKIYHLIRSIGLLKQRLEVAYRKVGNKAEESIAWLVDF